MATASGSASKFLSWVHILNSLYDALWLEHVTWNKTQLSKVIFGHGVLVATVVTLRHW